MCVCVCALQIGNACGTIGLLHSIANTSARNTLSNDSPLGQLLREAASLNATDRAAYLQTSEKLAQAHTSAASGGQTAAPAAEVPVDDLHFVSYVRDPSTKRLFELDGRRRGPVNRKVEVPLQEDLLTVATTWVKDNYVSLTRLLGMCVEQDTDPFPFCFIRQMRLNPEEVHFNLVALTSVS